MNTIRARNLRPSIVPARTVILLLIGWVLTPVPVRAGAHHVWEKVEITLNAKDSCDNPYKDVTGWVDLKGPGFEKRCYGFWDGGDVFRVRVMAPAPDTWTWRSGSSPDDSGRAGTTGSFTATAWTDEALETNPCRRGMVRATPNGHAFEYADGTPFFLLALHPIRLEPLPGEHLPLQPDPLRHALGKHPGGAVESSGQQGDRGFRHVRQRPFGWFGRAHLRCRRLAGRHVERRGRKGLEVADLESPPVALGRSDAPPENLHLSEGESYQNLIPAD